MIPKKIHYCWFGGAEKPRLVTKCIDSWKKYCPDYEVIEWNENNFDINMNGYTKWCYETKRYAFLSDYVRLWVVYQHGGLYLDTDVELIRNPDFLLADEAFFGFENEQWVNTGHGFGSVSQGAALHYMLAEYEPLLDGKSGTLGCPRLNTQALLKVGLQRNGKYQKLSSATIYPKEYFNPYESKIGKLNNTKSTVSVHWYTGSWLTPAQKLRSVIGRFVRRVFGENFAEKFKR